MRTERTVAHTLDSLIDVVLICMDDKTMHVRASLAAPQVHPESDDGACGLRPHMARRAHTPANKGSLRLLHDGGGDVTGDVNGHPRLLSLRATTLSQVVEQRSDEAVAAHARLRLSPEG